MKKRTIVLFILMSVFALPIDIIPYVAYADNSVVTASIGNGFYAPMKSWRKSDGKAGFIPGKRWDSSGYSHLALDCISARGWLNEEIYPIYDGTIIAAGYGGAAGNYVRVRHEYRGITFYSQYQHLSQIKQSSGQVKGGSSLIGIEGNTGSVVGNPGNHLHLIVWSGDDYPYTRPIYPSSDRLGAYGEYVYEPYLECSNDKGKQVKLYNPELILNGSYVIGSELVPTNPEESRFYEYEKELYTEYAWYKGKNNGKKHYINSRPYARSTNATSQSCVQNLTVLPGKGQGYYTTETMMVYAVVENAYGNIWYKVKTGGGQEGYVFSGEVEYVGVPSNYASFVRTSGINISDQSIVNIDRGYFPLSGTITLPSLIKHVEARILDKNGSEVRVGTQHSIGGYTCDLSDSINDQLTFGGLTKGEYYTYEIKVFGYQNQKKNNPLCYTYSARFWIDDGSGRRPDFSSTPSSDVEGSYVLTKDAITYNKSGSSFHVSSSGATHGGSGSGGRTFWNYIAAGTSVFISKLFTVESHTVEAKTYGTARYMDDNNIVHESWIEIDDSLVKVSATEGGTWHAAPPVRVSVSSITLNRTNEVLHVDGQYKDKLYLSAVVSPANAADTSVTWSSSNPSVATVDQNGVVSAVAQNGNDHQTIITCTSNMDPNIKAICTVDVFEPISVNSIVLDKTSVELWANESDSNTVQLNATVDPVDATYTSVHWSSSNEDVAWVDGWGKVTGLAAGTATITCQSVKNQNITATCTVTVHQKVQDIYISAEREGLLPTETALLCALCFPTNADNMSVVWSSSDDRVASVDANGLVTANQYGEAVITATARDGSESAGSYTVSVEHEISLIGDVQNNTLYLDGCYSSIIGYAYASQGSVRRAVEHGYDLEWNLVNNSTEAADATFDVVTTVYTIDGVDYEIPSVVLYSGELHQAGTATFTLQCKAGPYTATVNLSTVVSEDELTKAVTINPSVFALSINEVANIPNSPVATDGGIVPEILSVNISGDTFYRSHAQLSSDDQNLCVWFSESGRYAAEVVYHAANVSYSVPVLFEVQDGDGLVRLPVTDVTLSESFVNIVVGETYQLSAEVLPVDAYNRNVTWISENENVATVSDDGLVTAIASGMVYIRCEASDGSGCYGSCGLNIEPFISMNEAPVEMTLYMDGQTHVIIDSCSLSYQSAVRVEEKKLTPQWTLSRISGDSTEIALNEYSSLADGDVNVEGVELYLLRLNQTGVDRYQLTCTAGGYSATRDIILTVSDGNDLPESISLITDSYEAEIGEEIEIDTAITCLPSGTGLPEDVSISIDPSRSFWNGMEDGGNFPELNLTFAEAGEYTADLVYSGANYRYAVPFTVRVKDETGVVPVAVQEIVMSEESVQLLVGDSVQLSVSVMPADAAYGSISWSSFDTSIATVSSNGSVTAMDAGVTYIIASTDLSDCLAICLVTVEDGLTLETESVTKTVFVDGATRTTLDKVFLTESSSKRLDSAPEWKLQRVSGNNLTLRCSGTESANENGDTLYGCDIILYSASAEGQTIYDLICSYGNERATTRITVNAVARKGNVPASIELSQTSYEADVGELIVVSPEITCWPSGTQLPEGTRVEFVGDRQFLAAVNQQDWFVSQSISTFSFAEAGRYEANCIYSYANISYTIPITFYIKDGNGSVPVHGRKMSLNTTSLQLVAGDESQLTAVFTPADVTDSSVTWMSSDAGVATVDSDGHVRAVANGTTEITCTPADTHCSAVTCYVTVEDYLTVETGNTSYSCYLEGEPDNLLSSAWLSEGTQQRMRRDGIIPTWTLTVTNGNSAAVVGKPEKDGSAIRVSTTSLNSAGTTNYSITCNAGNYQWTQDYSVVVNATGLQVPEHVTLATPEINLSVDEVKTINFAPVCQPGGTSLPQSITTSYVGIGGFYAALDRSVYDRNGDNVTVAFTKPGRYLLTRVYRAQNLDYTALCVINVGNPGDSGYGLLRTTEQECTVFMNGKSGAVADIAIYDATVYERFGNELQWNVERLSGDSITAGLAANGDKATLVVADAERTGTDVWRVSCTFGSITDFVDITIEVKEARKPIPISIELSKQRVTGMTGDWLHLPLGVKCNPKGSALPETGDDFWSFAMLGGLAEDVSENRIENGMLSVCFSESGYYTGNLTYRAGTISYTLPVYFTISDEESQIETPDQLKVWVLADSNTVYPEGDTNVTVATAVLAENLNSYYAGTAPSYAEANGITWSVSVNSGNAATLGIQRITANTADILLNSINGSGDVQYTVSATVNGTTYTGNGTLHVASPDEARPDVTLKQSRYQITQGVTATISRMLYQRSNGGALQSAGEWNVGSALAAIGYSYETTDDSWKVTFYKKGEYTTTVSAYVGNLRYVLPLTITVVGKADEEQYRTLKLPAALTTIEEEAFSGLTVQAIDLRGTKIKTIEKNAFKNCVDLVTIYIPSSVTSIANNAFYGCLNVTIHCVQGSNADSYASEHGLSVSYDMD